MWLNNSPKISEELALWVDVKDLSNFVAFGKKVKEAWLWDFSEDVAKAMEAIKLATEWVIYAFYVEDSWWSENEWNWHWIRLYRRIWNNLILQGFKYLRTTEVISLLIENDVKQILTWVIHWKFLWVESFTRDFDWDTIEHFALDEWSIEEITRAWIEVVVVDKLV